MPNRARTIGLVRLLKSLGGLRKTPGRVPRQQQPDGIRGSYYRALQRAVLEPLFRSTEQIKEIAVRGLERLRASEAKRDASGFHPATPRDVIRRLAEKQIEEFDPKPLREVVARFGRQTSAFQKEQLDRQVRSAVGVPFSAIERPARDPIPTFVDENVKLIKTVPERYFERMQRLVEEAYSTGMRPETLAEKLQELDDISDSDAMRIARDQNGKLNAASTSTSGARRRTTASATSTPSVKVRSSPGTLHRRTGTRAKRSSVGATPSPCSTSTRVNEAN